MIWSIGVATYISQSTQMDERGTECRIRHRWTQWKKQGRYSKKKRVQSVQIHNPSIARKQSICWVKIYMRLSISKIKQQPKRQNQTSKTSNRKMTQKWRSYLYDTHNPLKASKCITFWCGSPSRASNWSSFLIVHWYVICVSISMFLF